MLEYVLVLTAIVAAVGIGAALIKDKVGEGFTSAATAIDSANTALEGVTP